MKKTQIGKIISIKMNNTVIVEVTRRVAHPLYRKLVKKSKKYKVDSTGLTLNLGDKVKIGSIRPMSKEKYFKVLGVIK